MDNSQPSFQTCLTRDLSKQLLRLTVFKGTSWDVLTFQHILKASMISKKQTEFSYKNSLKDEKNEGTFVSEPTSVRADFAREKGRSSLSLEVKGQISNSRSCPRVSYDRFKPPLKLASLYFISNQSDKSNVLYRRVFSKSSGVVMRPWGCSHFDFFMRQFQSASLLSVQLASR